MLQCYLVVKVNNFSDNFYVVTRMLPLVALFRNSIIFGLFTFSLFYIN